MSSKRVRLWSDEPSPVDLRAFGAVAETAVEPVLDDAFDPIALGSRLAKRVLDDLNVRSAIAESRGIELDIWMVTKLMVLELLLSEECDMVLRWLAHGEPRRQLASFKFKGIAGPRGCRRSWLVGWKWWRFRCGNRPPWEQIRLETSAVAASCPLLRATIQEIS